MCKTEIVIWTHLKQTNKQTKKKSSVYSLNGVK